MKFFSICFLLIFFIIFKAQAQENFGAVKEIEVAKGWADNSVNAVIFRKNSIVTHGDNQYIAFYDPEKYVVLARRKLGTSKWDIEKTPYQGNAADAHNSISIMVDGNGYLHISWNHHNTSLNYAKSLAPGSLRLSEKLSMTGMSEDKVSYPEFYKMPNGDLLFFYRSGASGNGNLVINKYNLKTEKWEQMQSNLIDGEGERNAYWQACVDRQGTIHVSWVWRETWDVATNHDLCYARSNDGGKTWGNSTGEKYTLPITQETAEVAFHIPQNSELINQTSMSADRRGHPMIATYWREENTAVPQFHIVHFNGKKWKADVVTSREQPFSLSGGGTKQIPISRPQILLGQSAKEEFAIMLFRDAERGNKASVAFNQNFPSGKWEIFDLNDEDLGSWEPSYDTELWKDKGILNIFIQNVKQVDGEGLAKNEPQMVKVLVWRPQPKAGK